MIVAVLIVLVLLRRCLRRWSLYIFYRMCCYVCEVFLVCFIFLLFWESYDFASSSLLVDEGSVAVSVSVSICIFIILAHVYIFVWCNNFHSPLR